MKEEIRKFSREYFWFPYEYVGPEIWDEEKVIDKVKRALNDNIQKKDEINNTLKQEECIKKFKLNKEIVDLFSIIQTLTLMQDDRKMHNSHICYYVNEVIAHKLAEILRVDFKLARYIDDSIIEKFMKDKDFNYLKEKLKARSEFFVQRIFQDGSYTLHEGEEGKKILEKEGIKLKTDLKVSELKGIGAYSGKAMGRARVLRSSSNVTDFKEGDIIVTGMTTPDFAPLIKKAAAIITDEGGITCHAAIVARELKKPAVIGTKIATQVIPEGSLVEVDADKGIVKILEKAK